MNRTHFSTRRLMLPVMLIALLLPLGVAYAAAPTPVSGSFARVGPVRNRVVVEVGGNTIVTSDLTQAWAGGISGTAEVHRRTVNHPNGEFTSHLRATCTCTVDGVSGIFYINIQGRSDPNEELGLATWTIIGGEGGLAGLHGQGTSSQVFPNPDLYEGAVHFQP
jgi:hypothetical protein